MFSCALEASDTTAILGASDHDIGNHFLQSMGPWGLMEGTTSPIQDLFKPTCRQNEGTFEFLLSHPEGYLSVGDIGPVSPNIYIYIYMDIYIYIYMHYTTINLWVLVRSCRLAQRRQKCREATSWHLTAYMYKWSEGCDCCPINWGVLHVGVLMTGALSWSVLGATDFWKLPCSPAHRELSAPKGLN